MSEDVTKKTFKIITDPTKEPADLNHYASNFTKIFINEINGLIDSESARLGQDLKVLLESTLISGMVYNTIFKRLELIATQSTSEDEKYKRYKDHKTMIENAVAVGFQIAFKQFTAIDTDYFCQVLPVPEAVNREPC